MLTVNRIPVKASPGFRDNGKFSRNGLSFTVRGESIVNESEFKKIAPALVLGAVTVAVKFTELPGTPTPAGASEKVRIVAACAIGADGRIAAVKARSVQIVFLIIVIFCSFSFC